MADYRIHLLDSSGKVTRHYDVNCAGDEGAYHLAKGTLALGERAEVWTGKRCVSRGVSPPGVETVPTIVSSDRSPAPTIPDEVQFKDLTELPQVTSACARAGGEWVNAQPAVGRSEATQIVDSAAAETPSRPAAPSWSGTDRRRPDRAEYANPELIALMRLTFRNGVPDVADAMPTAEFAQAGSHLPNTVNNQPLCIDAPKLCSQPSTAQRGDGGQGTLLHDQDGNVTYSAH